MEFASGRIRAVEDAFARSVLFSFDVEAETVTVGDETVDVSISDAQASSSTGLTTRSKVARSGASTLT